MTLLQSRLVRLTGGLIFLFAVAIAAFFYLTDRKQAPVRDAAAMPARENPETSGNSLRPAEWWYIMREYPDFRTDVNTYVQAMTAAANTVHQRGGYPGFTAPWTVQGPGNIGARVNTIKVHPVNRDIIYIGYSQGGVWKTTDGGENWLPIFDQNTFLSIGDIELDPQNPEVVYVGTGDPNIGGYPFIGDGLWKSTDGGQHWQHLGLSNQRILSKIIVHPSNSNIIYAAAMGLPFERNTDRGLYKTTDGGLSWKQVLFLSDSTGVIDLTMSPADPEVLYAAGWDRIRNNRESLASGPNARIWKTQDGGAHWALLAGGLPQDSKSRIGLAIDVQNGDRLAAIYADTSLSFYGIYESTDGGLNWQQSPAVDLNPDFQSNFAWYFGKIFINPFNPDDIYVCGVELWRSLDGGDSWFQTTPPWWLYEVHADAHDMAFIDAETCLLATDGGLYKSVDAGFTWEKIENIPTSQFYRVAFNPFAPDLCYGGMQDNGTSAGNAGFIGDWPRLFGGDGFQPVFHPTDPNIYYFETQNGNIVGTTNGGQSVVSAKEGIESNDRRHWDMPYFLSRHDPEIMYTGTYRVYQGFGHIPSWSPVSQDLTDGNIYGSRFHTISTLDESSFVPGLLYVGTTDGNVWRGSPSGQIWTDITAGLPDRYVSSVKASPNVANRIYVAHTGYKSNDFTPHIHRSDDNGETWISVAGDLPNLAINDIQIMPGQQDSMLFVATDGGVYGTLDGGQHWERLGSDMPVVPVYDLDLNPEQRTLIAGTFARSIMTFPLDSLQAGNNVPVVTPGPANRPALLVMPNPAKAYTTIALRNLAAGEETDIVIADLSGRSMWKRRVTGSPEIPLALHAFEPGVYLVFARTNGRVWGQQKLVLAR